VNPRTSRTPTVLVLALILVAAAPARLWAAWGANGMVAADHRLASQAGVEMLQRGGNAVDAAVATAFAVGVVNPSSCGLGGGGFMLIYLARHHRTVALDYREVAPAAATPDMFVRDGRAVPELSQFGGLAVAVPGEVAGLSLVLRRFGTLPLATTLEPAIRYARDGFVIEPHLATEIARNQNAFRADPHLARTFLRADGSPLDAGDTLRRPELAHTLERLAHDGPEPFYRGDIATVIAASTQRSGGILTERDLATYRPRWRRPLVGQWHHDAIHTMPPPSSGGGVLLEVLGMLRHDDLPALGQESATYLHLLAEAMGHGFADRARFYGDPDQVRVPLGFLLSPPNTAALRRRISAAHTGAPDTYGSEVGAAARAATDHGTSHLSVMDAHGNAVACTTTINTSFGSRVVAGDTGIILNNEMDDFSAQPGAPNAFGLVGTTANAIAPGKRPLSSMSPTIVVRHNVPTLALGGSGGPLIITGTLQVLLNVLAYNFDATTAVAAPRIHHQWSPPVLAVEPGVAAGAGSALARVGHAVKEVPAMGAIQAVRRTAGVFEGASDPRKGGEAAGW
jgi:gamma-glutamyltranspeptidase/glutathione hydrolase